MRSVLRSHNEVAIPPETQFFTKLLSRARPYMRRVQIADIDGFLRLVRRDKRMGSFLQFLDDPILKQRPWTAGEFLEFLCTRYAHSLGKTRWGEKTPSHLWRWKLIRSLYPECKFILMVRDGRDVVCSLDKVTWNADAPLVNAFRWKMDVRIGRRLEEALGPRRVLRVSYENLIRAPEATVREVCTFLGLTFEPGMLEPFGAKDDAAPSFEREARAENVGAFRSSSVGRYQRDLGPRRIASLNALMHSELEALGRLEEDAELPGVIARAGIWLRSAMTFCFAFSKRFAKNRLES